MIMGYKKKNMFAALHVSIDHDTLLEIHLICLNREFIESWQLFIEQDYWQIFIPHSPDLKETDRKDKTDGPKLV